MRRPLIHHFRLERTNDIPLEFDGEILASVTTEFDNEPWESKKERWTEHRIFRTNTGKYVVETIGGTRKPGESVRRSVTVVDDPREIPQALRQPRTYLTQLAKLALEDANMKDSRVPLTDRV